MEAPNYHEIIRPLRELSHMTIQKVIEWAVPEDVFDDFLAGGPLDTPRPGGIGAVPTQPTLWE